MDAVSNPYTPNAGAAPEIVVGRDDQLEAFTVLLRRLERGRTEQSMIITGLRGVGKTVLLGQFGDIARRAGWEVVEIEASKHDDTRFRQAMFSQLKAALLRLSPRARWTERARNAAEVLSAFAVSVDQKGTFSVSWDVPAAEGAADHGDLSMDLTDVFVALGEAADEQHRGVALLIDEVQFLGRAQLEALIQAMHKTVQRRLPSSSSGRGCRRSPSWRGTRSRTPSGCSPSPGSGRSRATTHGPRSSSPRGSRGSRSTTTRSTSPYGSRRATPTSSRSSATRSGGWRATTA